MKSPSLYRSRLQNGLTILVQPLHNLESVSVGLSVGVGSRYESLGNAGMSHFVEHMLFQGTQRRDVQELSRVISAIGGTLDACTGRESTVYYAKVPGRHFTLAMDVLADMVLHSRFAGSAMQKEKNIICEEIRMYEDSPEDWVHDLLFQAMWPRHPLGRSILGTPPSLRAIQRPDVLRFMRANYLPQNMILSVAGSVTPAQVVKQARRWLGESVLPGRNRVAAPGALQPDFNHLIHRRPLEQVHVCLGVLGMPFTNAKRLTALALSNVLGGGANSRLFYEVREKRALVYSVYSFMDFYQDTGIGGIYFACHPKKVKEALRVIQTEITRLASSPITSREYQDVREQMCGHYVISLESSSTHMWNMIHQEMYLHAHPSPAGVLKAIGRISKTGIQKLAQELFVNKPVAAALVGPVTKDAYKSLQEFMIKTKKTKK